MQTYDGIMDDTMRDQSAIPFPPVHSIEPQSSDRSDCTDKSSRNSRIVTRSIFGPLPRFRYGNHEDGYIGMDIRVHLAYNSRCANGLRSGSVLIGNAITR